jgi:dTDP-glucose 4,6-dehydratase
VNLSSNYEVSVSAVAEVLQELMNKKVKITSDEERVRPKASEVERLWGDNQKAAKLLNWRPEFSGVEGLKRGLKTTIDWFTVPENLRRYKTGSYTI